MSEDPEYYERLIEWACQIMGYEGLRAGQREIVDNIANEKDTIGVMPTGSGKTATFVIPCLALKRRAVVVSPLIALQADQINALRAKGVAAAAMNSAQTARENSEAAKNWMAGKLQFLYLSPEKFTTDVGQSIIMGCRPDLVVVDECHTSSEWGRSFRTSFSRLGAAINAMGRPTVLALTATLTPEAEVTMREMVDIQDATRFTYYQRRANLKFETHKEGLLVSQLAQRIDTIDGKVLIYCPTVKEIDGQPGMDEARTRSSSKWGLFEQLLNHMGGTGVTRYHGRLTAAIKKTAQDLFTEGHAKVMIATNAFGMGIDLPDVRMVVHMGLPGTVESYVQEVGRAGRDGLDSICLINGGTKAASFREWSIDNTYPKRSDAQRVLSVLRRNPEETRMTVAELAAVAGLPEPRVSGCLGLMGAAEMIERGRLEYMHSASAGHRFTDDLPPATVRALKEGEEAILNDIRSVIERSGKWTCSPADFAKSRGIKVGQLNALLGRADSLGLFDVRMASRGSYTTLLKEDINAIDWSEIDRVRSAEKQSLRRMLRFVTVPDAEKHAAAEHYFRHGKLPAKYA